MNAEDQLLMRLQDAEHELRTVTEVLAKYLVDRDPHCVGELARKLAAAGWWMLPAVQEIQDDLARGCARVREAV